MPQLRIGTSGWLYNHWRGLFYPRGLPASRWFAHYARHFDTVELNNPFYRQPSRATFVKWRTQSPADFVYAVKLNRYLTQFKRLNVTLETIRRSYDPLAGLGPKAAVVLVQLPPRMRFDPARVDRFFRQVRRRRKRHALEPRHSSWLTDEALDALRRNGVALCIADGPKYETREAITADFTYLRFHGRERLYASNYRDDALREWAVRIRAWSASGLDVYAYFNNDARGYAVSNALRLRELLA
jgi:uncharacterized protein YecE (DUF72 family)